MHRRLQYVSPSNAFITIGVTPLGGSTTTTPATAFTSAACTISFTALPGPNTLAFTLTDASSNVLSKFTNVVVVQPATLNTFAFSANPVVSSVSLQLGSASAAADTAANIALTVQARDAAGNIIAGNQNYVDANGNSVTLQLSVANTRDSGTYGSVTILGSSRISAPSQALTYAHYDGQQISGATFSVTSNSSVLSSLTGATLGINPTVIQEYGGLALPPRGIIIGPDNNLWIGTDTSLVSMTKTGSFSTITSAASGFGLTPATDGSVWSTQPGNATHTIYRVTRTGNVTAYVNSSFHAYFIAVAADGNFWLGGENTNTIESVTPNDVITQFPLLASGECPYGIALGSDGNIWFASRCTSNVGKITPGGTITEYPTTTSNSQPYEITAAPDCNMWFTEVNSNKIGKITPSVTITEYTVPTASSQPDGIVAGPDGNIWFTKFAGNKIGRITMSGTITEATIPTTGTQSLFINVGPDGYLYFTESNTNSVGKVMY